MELSFCCLNFTKRNLNERSIVFTDLLPYVISGPYNKWCYCCSHITSLCGHYADILDCRKPKVEAGVASSGIISIPDFIKIHSVILKWKHGYTDMASLLCIHFMDTMQRVYKKEMLQVDILWQTARIPTVPYNQMEGILCCFPHLINVSCVFIVLQ